jgi:protein-tyrosine phosphatase
MNPADPNDEGTLGRVAADPELLISDFFRRLDELEALAREIASHLSHAGPLPKPPARRSRDFELVVVCTGNRVRSPVAEGFLRVLLAGLPVHISSAGVLDLGPVPALPETIETAAALGLDLSAHRAGCVVGRDLSGADLVVGFEQRHVATAVVDAQAPRERSFTLVEIVDLLERVLPATAEEPAERACQAVARADALRQGRQDPVPEIPDPLGGSVEVYRTTISRVRDLSERLAVRLFGFEAVQPLPAVAGADPPPGRRRTLRVARENR